MSSKKLTTVERNTRKRDVLSAIITKMVKGTFFTVLYQDDGVSPIAKEVNGRLGVKFSLGTGEYSNEYLIMDEFMYLWRPKHKVIEKIPVDNILGIKHNGILTCINGNKSSKYDATKSVLTFID